MAELAEIQQYKTKNILLEHPADWYIEKKTFDAVKQSLPTIVNFYNKQRQQQPRANKVASSYKRAVKRCIYGSFLFSKVLLDIIR
jgi:hypothetical protein